MNTYFPPWKEDAAMSWNKTDSPSVGHIYSNWMCRHCLLFQESPGFMSSSYRFGIAFTCAVYTCIILLKWLLDFWKGISLLWSIHWRDISVEHLLCAWHRAKLWGYPVNKTPKDWCPHGFKPQFHQSTLKLFPPHFVKLHCRIWLIKKRIN